MTKKKLVFVLSSALVITSLLLLGCSNRIDLTGNWKGTKIIDATDGRGLNPKLKETSVSLMISQKGQDVTGTYTETAPGFYTVNYPLTGLVTKDQFTFTAANLTFSGKYNASEISGELKTLAKYSLKVRK